MTEPLIISSAAPERTSMNYTALREGGMELIRTLAQQSWTDHNVHDPGITLLEAFSYAMTELGVRIQLDMPDLLQSGAHNAPADLIPAHRVLPCMPVTPHDFIAVLVDNPLIRDARITTHAHTEIPLFALPSGDPPLSYSQNTAPVHLNGLYEAIVEFAERDLNSNTYTLFVTVSVPVPGTSYTLEMALPYWDEDAVRPFWHGPTIDSVTLLDDGGIRWRPLDESQSYFGEIQVDYTDTGTSDRTKLWVILRITDELQQPSLVTTDILNAASTAMQSTAAGGLIDTFALRVRSAHSAMQQVSHYISTFRNLCEDTVHIGVVREQEIAVRARIEVSGSIDLEKLLADIFFAIDRLLAPAVRFSSMAALRAAGTGVEKIFDGPLLRNGFLDEATPNASTLKTVYISDILRLIMQRRNASGTDVVAQENPGGRDIIAVTDLALSNYINNRPITVEAKNCLHLVETERYRPRLSLAKSHVIFVRNDAEVHYDSARVSELFSALREADDASSLPADTSPVWPVARGDSLPIEDYIPLQNELPRIYGVGEAHLPDSAGTERLAAVMQFKGYLLLFEQFLADLTAQLGNINRFFSSDPEEQVTYFNRALYELPDIKKLLVQFPSGGDWEAFVTDPDNPYNLGLRQALESREIYLDRRNRMLDHLLARQGEALVAYGQELHRYAQRELQEGIVDPLVLPVRMEKRRQAANTRLILAKATLLHDAPWLNGARLQAFGNPLHHDDSILQIESAGTNFHWSLTLGAHMLLQSATDHPRHSAATIAAEEAAVLASQSSSYAIVSAGGGRSRYQLEDRSGTVIRIVGESPLTFASVTSAESAALSCAQHFADLRISASLTPLEQRIAHTCGIRTRMRRRLLTPINAFFEIYDEVDSDSIIEKRWRLWEQPGYSGRVMLSSVFHFEAGTDPEAIALAEESIHKVLRYGQDEWNYAASLAGILTYNFDLWHPDGSKLGMRNPPYPSEAAAQTGIEETVAHLYRHYSAEGFHLVEHLLLRPRQDSDAFLSFPSGPDTYERDPYSHRLSLVFPSGWMRDFSVPEENATRSATEPHRFRDIEFRRHVERMVQQACPAHLLPSIFWVDRQLPGTPDAAHSFDGFEAAYFNWLTSILIPGSDPTDSAAARNALIESLNGVANG